MALRIESKLTSIKKGAVYGALVLGIAASLTAWEETIIDCTKKVTGNIPEDNWFEKTTRDLGLRFSNVPSEKLLKIASHHQQNKVFINNRRYHCTRDARAQVLGF